MAENPTIIGPLSISLQPNGTIELRTFERTDKNTLTAEQAMRLLQWLYEQKDALSQISQIAARVTCEGCGYEYDPDEMGVLPVEVHLRDGTTRDVHLCDVVCVDFWDETAPGDWVELHSGEEVQRVNWVCDVCQSVLEYKLVTYLVDTHDFDPDNPVDSGPQAEYLVCSSCRKREKGRFKTREEIGG